ncbi:hypothetical protein [Breznakiella homolactica]|uniref:Peptidase M30 n=1 Tax=Breznakiella homolactica TaxID=2798577 RepID=A0A7T8BBE3_9SPIR|nr:hypothetical protein [Breznakiella homolactica]QQO10472.1 hypothetical protein JFL75_06035 [Breznakiella homolactica]
MKKTMVLYIITPLLLALASCEDSGGGTYAGRSSRQFYAQDIYQSELQNKSVYYTVNAVHLAENSTCIVYADRNAGVSIATAETIAAEFQNNIVYKITNAFGPFGDLDGNRKLILLLLDIRDGYSGSGYVAGYFNPSDMFQRSTRYPYSNQADMIYLDTNPGQPGTTEFYSTIAHELQHQINFTASVDYRIIGNTIYDMDTWIDEGLSSAAEYIYRGGHYTQRINYFNSDRGGTISKGNNFFVWQNDANVLDEYATVYLFFQWLRIQSGGTGIYKNIIQSPDYDYHAVTAAATSIGGPYSDWGTLMREWLLANYVNSATGTLGYKGEIQTTTYAISDNTRNLLPGEGVYSKINTQFDVTDTGNIRYAGATKNSTLISTTTPYTGTRLLTFNSNDSNAVFNTSGNIVSSAYETGQLTGNGDSRSVVEAGRQAYQNPGKYPVDAAAILGERERTFDGTDLLYGKN